MQIKDYETGKELRDLAISLTPEEASDMIAYLQRLVAQPGVVRIHMSEVKRDRIEKEITFALESRKRPHHAFFKLA